MNMTKEDVETLITAMFLLGFLGAIAWDFLKWVCIAVVSAIGALFDRHERIKQARLRAPDDAIFTFKQIG